MRPFRSPPRRWPVSILVALVLFSSFSCVSFALEDIGTSGPITTSRTVVDTFNDGLSDITYSFSRDEVKKTAWLTLENNSYIDEATLLVRGLPYTAGTRTYPLEPEIDLGDDGDIEWAFSYTGSGKLGLQGLLSNDSRYNSIDVKTGVDDTSTTFRLPINSTVTEATLNIEGRFRVRERVVINGSANNDELGRSLAFVGDLDGDTWEDFAVGIPQNDTAQYDDGGKVMVYLGGASMDSDPDFVITGTNVSDQYGFNIAPAGDVNNDGYDDLLVGTPFNDTTQNNAGRVYIYYGGDPFDTTVDVTMTGEDVGDWFGSSATGVGDINDDGYDDVVSTSPNWGFPVGESFHQYGRMYVYFGGNPMDNVADLVVQGPTLGSTWGSAIAPVGDFNNDGYDDFVLGTYSNDVSCNNCGKFELFLGGSPFNSGIDMTVYGSGGEEMGFSAAPLGDLNKDNYDDFIVGARRNADKGSSTGAAYVYLGGSPIDSTADLTIHGHSQGDVLGCDVSSAGDINKDGWLDILVGAEGNDTSVKDSGAAFVLFGGPSLDNVTDLVIPGEAGDDLFGSALSGGVDINKDGFYDLLIGAYKNDANHTNGGRAYLFNTVPRKAIDPVLDLSGAADPPGDMWSHTGAFMDNVTVPDFKDQLNAYLANASMTGTDGYGNDYVDISLSVSTGHDAEFVISNLSIFYDYDAVVDVNPNSWTGSLQAELDAKVPHEDTGTTKVTVWARSKDVSKLWLHHLRVVADEGPQVSGLSSFTMEEDTLRPHLVDLHDHYDDEYDPDDFLTYEVVSFTNPEYVNATINDSHYLSVDALTGDMNDNWTGSTQVVVKAIDTRGLSKVSNSFTVSVTQVNDRPVFISAPVLTAVATRQYSYQAQAADDGGSITYEKASGPGAMSVDASTGLVTWTPGAVGQYDVSIRATDGSLAALQNFSITVTPPNDPPKITSTPQTEATVGYHYTYQLVATDPDGDPLEANLTVHPAGMSMDGSWMLSYIPASDQIGDHTVTVEVTDGKVVVQQSYTLSVTDLGMNNVPFFVSTPTAVAVVGNAYEYTLVAMDDDNDPLVYSLDESPDGMFITGDLIEWVPTDDQFGQHQVVARVSDNRAYSLQRYTIDVSRTGANHAPVIVSTPPTTAKVGYTLEYQVEARDDDLDPLVYSLDTTHKRMTMGEDTGLLVWHPTSDAVGNQTVTVRVSDGKGFDTQTFVVEVQSMDRNNLPIFLSNPGTEAKVGVGYSYQPNVQDPDSDTVTFTLFDPPSGMTVEPTTGTISWTPVAGQEGNVTVELRASDGKGYASQTFVVHVQAADVVVDLRVAITSPVAGSELSGNITVKGTASVNVGELFEVQVKLDDGAWRPANGLESWSYPIDTTLLKNGPHSVKARAWDGDIYSGNVTVEFTVKNKEPEKPDDKPFTLFGMDAIFCMFILVLMVVVVVGVIMALRKSPAAPPPRDRGQGGRARPERRPSRPMPRPRERDRYEESYEEGYDEGPDEGYDGGYEEGYDRHDDEYYDEGYGMEKEYDDGY